MQPLSAREVITSVVGNTVFALLLLALRWIRGVLANRDPRYWWIIPSVTAAVWIISNLSYGWFFGSYNNVFFYVSTILSVCVLLDGIRQFWTIGLVGADVQIKKGIDAARALRMCSSSLEFLGIGASKLTQLNKIFTDAIDRCDSTRPVRFLLSSPESAQLKSIAQKAGRADSEYRETVLTSLRVLAGLRNQRSKNIQVRFYVNFPAFRIMFIDDQICLASHYVFGKGDGSDLPQLHIIRKTGSQDINSLYYGFRAFFDRMWEESTPWDFQKYLSE